MLRLAALIVWIVVILWLSLTPRPPHFGFSELLSWDKLQHVCGYALLTLLAGLFFARWRQASRFPWRYALLLTLLYGGLIEILQGTLTDVRRAQWADLAADAVGGGFVCAAALLLKRLRQERGGPRG